MEKNRRYHLSSSDKISPYSICGDWYFVKDGHCIMMECNCWKCPFCRVEKVCKLRSNIVEMAERYNLKWMITLTIDPKKGDNRGYNEYTKKVWRKFTRRLRERCMELQYIWFLEYHKVKNPYPHLHILLNKEISQEWVQARWEKCGGGWNVDVRELNGTEHAAKYVCKYISKTSVESSMRLAGKGRVWGRTRNCLTWYETASIMVDRGHHVSNVTKASMPGRRLSQDIKGDLIDFDCDGNVIIIRAEKEQFWNGS